METLFDLIEKQNWIKIYKNWIPDQIVEKLSYEDSMCLAYQMLINKEGNEDFRNFAVDLLQIIRNRFQQNWRCDWRNDLFLGDACHITMRLTERYEAYKRASLMFNTMDDLPPTLLVSLARCYSAPGNPPISIKEAEKFAKVAVNKERSIESVTILRGIYKTLKKEKEFSYWDHILDKLEKKKLYARNEWPAFLEKKDS